MYKRPQLTLWWAKHIWGPTDPRTSSPWLTILSMPFAVFTSSWVGIGQTLCLRYSQDTDYTMIKMQEPERATIHDSTFRRDPPSHYSQPSLLCSLRKAAGPGQTLEVIWVTIVLWMNRAQLCSLAGAKQVLTSWNVLYFPLICFSWVIWQRWMGPWVTGDVLRRCRECSWEQAGSLRAFWRQKNN